MLLQKKTITTKQNKSAARIVAVYPGCFNSSSPFVVVVFPGMHLIVLRFSFDIGVTNEHEVMRHANVRFTLRSVQLNTKTHVPIPSLHSKQQLHNCGKVACICISL